MTDQQWDHLQETCRTIGLALPHIQNVIKRLKELYDPKDDRRILEYHAECAAGKDFQATTIIGLYLLFYGGW